MLLSGITLGQTYYTCCYINGQKNVSLGTVVGKFEYVDSAFVDMLLDESEGFGSQIIRPNVTDVFATAAEAVDVLETFLSTVTTITQDTIDALKTKYNIVE